MSYLILLATFIAGIVVMYIICRRKETNASTEQNEYVEYLKNAMLAYALRGVKYASFDQFNMNYSSFDGSKLPMMSGYSTSNACFSYIANKKDARKNPFSSPIMEEKTDAIDRYIKRNLNTQEKVLDFFDEFVEKFTPEETIIKDNAVNSSNEPENE
jgi:hypothetical protein